MQGSPGACAHGHHTGFREGKPMLNSWVSYGLMFLGETEKHNRPKMKSRVFWAKVGSVF